MIGLFHVGVTLTLYPLMDKLESRTLIPEPEKCAAYLAVMCLRIYSLLAKLPVSSLTDNEDVSFLLCSFI